MRSKDLALDDEQLRKINNKKLVTAVDSIGSLAKTYEKTARMSKYYLIGMLLMILIIVFGGMLVVYIKSDGFDSFIDNMYQTDNLNKRILCTNEINNNMSFRVPAAAIKFKELFNNSHCEIINTNRVIKNESDNTEISTLEKKG